MSLDERENPPRLRVKKVCIMNIALMNQFVPPAHAPTGKLLHDLAEALRDRGHSVTVIGSKDRYGRATGIFTKLREYAAFYFCAHRTLNELNPPPDVVVSMTTPPFIGLIAARFKKRTNVPFILWCMDLYPEALAASGMLKEKGFLYRLLGRLTRSERTEASCIITLGPDMTRRVRASSPSVAIEEIPVWSRLETSPEAEQAARELRRARGWGDDEIICLYSGNIGRAHCVEEFVELAKQLRGMTPRIQMVFCGEGPLKESWKQCGGDLFQWVEPVAEEELIAHLLSADVHLISQRPEWVGVVVPSKYQAACALGRPVLFAGPSDSAVAGWIRDFGNGWVLHAGDKETLEEIAGQLSCPSAVLPNPFNRNSLLERLVRQVEQTGRER